MQIATLADARAYLEGFINLERRSAFPYAKLGTRRVRALLEAIGNPHLGLPCVHIAGSKGKGTVALASEALLRAAGYRVGTYTSPHLESWVERFRIDVASLSTIQRCENVKASSHIGMIGREGFFTDAERAFVERLGFGVMPHLHK